MAEGPGHVAELVGLSGPAVALPGEGVDQPVGRLHPLLRPLRVVLRKRRAIRQARDVDTTHPGS